jgi:hypothetical protein
LSFSFRFSNKNIVYIFYFSHACYIPRSSHPPSFYHHNIISWSKLWSSSLCSLLQPHTTSSLLGQNILLNTLFSNTLICVLLLVWETKFHRHTKQQGKWCFCVFQSVSFWRGNGKIEAWTEW